MRQIIIAHLHRPDSSKLLNLFPSFERLGMGEVFRLNLKERSPSGKKARTFMDNGELVPSEVVFELIENYLRRFPKNYILFYYPKNIENTKYFLSLLPKLEYRLFKVYLPEKEARLAFFDKIIKSRTTDNPSDKVLIQKQRDRYLKDFEQILEMADYLKSQGIPVQTISFGEDVNANHHKKEDL